MFRFKLNLNNLVSTTNFPQLGFYEIINIENCSLANLVSISMLHIQYQNGTPILTGVATYEDESTEQLIKTGSQDILSLSDTEDYIIFDADLPENSLLQQTIFYYIQIGVIDVLPLEDSDYISLVLFLQNSENDKLDKVLTTTGLMNGLFNHATGYKNIDIDVTGYKFEFNYVYIPTFERYYYVDSIELVASNITRLHLKEDVLMTWKELIKEQKAFVSRYENSTELGLVDTRFPLEDKLTSTSLSVTDTPSTDSFVNCTLDFEFTNYNDSVNIAIVTQSKTLTSNNLIVQAPSNSGLPNIRGRFNDRQSIRFINLNLLHWLINAYASDDATSSFIYSVLWLPFDAKNLFNAHSRNETGYGVPAIFVNDKVINQLGEYINESVVDWNDPASPNAPLNCYEPFFIGTSDKGNDSECPYIIIKDFTYSRGNIYFNDREPYSNYEIFVPFVGWISVESQKFINKRILIYYTMDLISGLATAYIYNYTDKYVIWSGTCQIGIKVDLTSTNILENARQKQNADLNMSIGVMSSMLSMVAGAISKNPSQVVGGISKTGKAIASNVNAKNLLFERAQITTGSSDGSLHSNKDVKIRKTYHVPVSIDSATYKHLQGLPYNKYVSSLSALTGYVEIDEIHFDPKGEKIYQDEIVEITDLLQKGCIF